MNYKISKIRDKVYLLHADTQYALCSMFMRPQEFYESPIEGIQGNFFSHEKFMDLYAESKWHKEFTYYEDWSGFNIPGKVLVEFYKTFEQNLSEKEKLLSNLLFSSEDHPTDDHSFYVIGIFGEIDPTVLDHELSHAYWYLNSEYVAEMKACLTNLDTTIYEKMRAKLLSMGYDEKTIEDEVCSYLATTNDKSIVNFFKLGKSTSIPSTFKEVFLKHNSPTGGEK